MIKLEKIESSNTDKVFKLLKYLGIASAVIAIIRLFLFKHKHFEDIEFDSLIGLALAIVFGVAASIANTAKQTKNRFGQFIEWNEKSFSFKTRGQDLPECIYYDKIINITIRLEIINVTTSDNSTKEIDISDFRNYEKRLRIKQNFEILKKNI